METCHLAASRARAQSLESGSKSPCPSPYLPRQAPAVAGPAARDSHTRSPSPQLLPAGAPWQPREAKRGRKPALGEAPKVNARARWQRRRQEPVARPASSASFWKLPGRAAPFPSRGPEGHPQGKGAGSVRLQGVSWQAGGGSPRGTARDRGPESSSRRPHLCELPPRERQVPPPHRAPRARAARRLPLHAAEQGTATRQGCGDLLVGASPAAQSR